MFKVKPLEPWHVHDLLCEPHNQSLQAVFTPDYIKAIMELNDCVTGFVGMDIVVCAGIVQFWPGRAHLWAIFSEKLKKHPVTATRGMVKFLNDQPYNRIETDAQAGYLRARKRAKTMGLHFYGHAKKFYPNGNDADLYAWVRK